MAVLLNRTKNHLHRYLSHIHTSFHHRYIYSHHSPHHSITQTLISNPTLSHSPPFAVRFFAAPIQFLKKEEVKKVTGVRLNEQIVADFVRLVSDEGHTVLARHEALRRAKSLKLDLVEVDRHAEPPVCKILDYNKEKYQKQVKEKERSKKKSDGSLKKGDCKEVRFSAKTETKDLKMKADMVKRLMERGYRVKCMAMGTKDKATGTKDKATGTKDKATGTKDKATGTKDKATGTKDKATGTKDKATGTEDKDTGTEDLSGLLSQLSSMIEDVAFVESAPRIEEKQAYIIVRHIKFGPSKKGVKKTSKVDGSETHNVADACNNTRADHLEEEEEANSSTEEEYATDNENASHQSQQEMVCRVSEVNHGLGPIYERNPNNGPTTEKQMKFGTKVATSSGAGLSPSRVPNFGNLNVRSSSQEPEPQPENRYARNVSKNVSAGRNTRVPYNGSQPHPRGGFIQGRGPRQDRDMGDVSDPRQVGSREPRTGAGGLRSPSSSSGFGIFSAKEVHQHESPSNSTMRNSNPDVLNSQSTKSGSDQKQGNADGRKWGVFSR